LNTQHRVAIIGGGSPRKFRGIPRRYPRVTERRRVARYADLDKASAAYRYSRWRLPQTVSLATALRTSSSLLSSSGQTSKRSTLRFARLLDRSNERALAHTHQHAAAPTALHVASDSGMMSAASDSLPNPRNSLVKHRTRREPGSFITARAETCFAAEKPGEIGDGKLLWPVSRYSSAGQVRRGLIRGLRR